MLRPDRNAVKHYRVQDPIRHLKVNVVLRKVSAAQIGLLASEADEDGDASRSLSLLLCTS